MAVYSLYLNKLTKVALNYEIDSSKSKLNNNLTMESKPF